MAKAEADVAPQVPGVDLPSDADKRAQQILDDAEQWGAQLHSVWVRLLNREKATILAKVKGSKAREGTKFWDGGEGYVETKAYDPRKLIGKARWLKELETETRELLTRFSKAYFRRAGVKGEKAEKLVEKLVDERVDPALEYHEAFLDRLAERAKEVAEREGSTVEDVAEVVTIVFDDAIANSESVAVSQMVGGLNQAQLELVMASGLKGQKVWFSAMDHRVRPTHRKPTHGQRRDFNKPFDVDGDDMQYPGDRTAPIGKWINCRCVLLFYPTAGGGGDEPVSGEEAASAWMGLQADLSDWIEAKAFRLRRVRTPGGREQYDQEIGTVIRPDVIPDVVPRVRVARPLPPVRDFSAWGERGKDIQRLFDTIDRDALTLPPREDEFNNPVPHPRTVAALRQIYEYQDPITGLTPKIRVVEAVGDDRWRVYGSIRTEDGRSAGAWEKTIDLGQDPPVAFHGLIQLYDQYQGQGFGERLLRHEENAYVAVGVQHVDLLAGLDGGGYAWARAGFDWHLTPGAFKAPWFKARRRIEEALGDWDPETTWDLTDDERAQLQDVLDRFRAGDEETLFPTPYEIAMLGYPGGQTVTQRRAPSQHHIGKRIMRGIEWEGRKTLIPPRGVKEWQLERARWLAARAEEWWQECEARDWRLGEDGIDWRPGTEPTDTETKLLRRVRTPEGVEHFNLPIGAPIIGRLPGGPDIPDLEVDLIPEEIPDPADMPRGARLHPGPLATVEEAEQWNEDSAEPGPWFHGTVDGYAIVDRGFDPEHVGTAYFGRGLYLTRRRKQAQGFGHNPLELRVRVHKVAQVNRYAGYDDETDAQYHMFLDLDKQAAREAGTLGTAHHFDYPHPLADEFSERIKMAGAKGQHDSSIVATEMLQEQGYDAVQVGDDWLVVLDPKDVVVVDQHYGPDPYADKPYTMDPEMGLIDKETGEPWVTAHGSAYMPRLFPGDERYEIELANWERAWQSRIDWANRRMGKGYLDWIEEKAGITLETKLRTADYTEYKALVRRVRTAAGVRYYHLPVGSPIVERDIPATAPARIARAATITPIQDRYLDALRQHPVNIKLGDAFRRNGFQLYLVGGSVRDAMAGKPDFADLDYTTDATPEDIKRIVDGLGPTWGIGEAFGTIGVQVDDLKVEVTTFRREEYDEASRNPTVAFGDNIEEDLARRDLTMNAMALVVAPGGGHRVGDLVDPHNGAKDLEDRVLRTPDDPQKSMTEDPLRQLRVVRFAAKMRARVDPDLAAAIRENKERLGIIAAERKSEELRKVLRGGPHTTIRALEVADDLEILDEMFGGLVTEEDVDEVINRLDHLTRPDAQLALLAAQSIEAGNDPVRIMARMKLSNEESRPAINAARMAMGMRAMDSDELATRMMIRLSDPDEMGAALSVAGAMGRGAGGAVAARIRAVSGTTLEQRLRGPLPIDGRDLIAEGLKGPEIGAALDRLTEKFVMFPTMERDEALAVALGRPVAKREGEEISFAWANALENATTEPPARGNFWLTKDGRWAPVAHHAIVFPKKEAGSDYYFSAYHTFTEQTGAVRVALFGDQVYVSIFKPLTEDQLHALAAARQDEMEIETEPSEESGPGRGFSESVNGRRYGSVVDALQRASDSLTTRVRYPSRLAQFKADPRWETYLVKAMVRRVRTPEGRERFGEEIGEVIRPDIVPSVSVPHRFMGNADQVDVLEESDHVSGLYDMYGEGLPTQYPDSPKLTLEREENRSAAKAEVVAAIHDRLSQGDKEALAQETAEQQVANIRSMLEGVMKHGDGERWGITPEVAERVLAELQNPWHPKLIWSRIEIGESGGGGHSTWKADWFDNIILLTGIDHPEGKKVVDPESGEQVIEKLGPEWDVRSRMVEYLRGEDTVVLIDALSADATSDFIHQWASTSNDSNPLALTIQEAVQEEFGLDDAMPWEMTWSPDALSLGLKEAHERDMDRLQGKKPLYGRMLRAMYDNTQEWFEANGIDEVLVYRGMKWKEWEGDPIPAWFDEVLMLPEEMGTDASGKPMPVGSDWVTADTPQLRPASSWAFDEKIAEGFSGKGATHRKQAWAILATAVPREAILSTPRTGFGCLSETEVVVLTFGGQSHILASAPARKEKLLGLSPQLDFAEIARLKWALENNVTSNILGEYLKYFGARTDYATMRARLWDLLREQEAKRFGGKSGAGAGG